MKQFFYPFVFCVLVLTACTGTFKKGENGLEYKIISGSGGKAMKYGNFVQMHIKQVYAGGKDSVLSDTRDFLAPIQLLDSVNTPLAYFKILRQLKKGDSAIIRLLTDTAFKGSPRGMPPFMKKGKFIYYYIKLVNIFETTAEADSASKIERTLAKPRIFRKQLEQVEKEIAKNKQQLDADDKLIAAFLTKNQIKAQKTKWGTYIAVTEEGTGKKIDYNSIVRIKYTGKTLDSSIVFDTNMDPGAEPIEVPIANIGSIIFGWTDALLQLKDGTKATIYIPSSLGYGKAGRDQIKPNDNLVFDIEIKEVLTEEEQAARQQATEQKMIEAERIRVDSIQKAFEKSKPKK